MLFLVLQLGTDRYAIEANEVVEILPLVASRQIPHSPPGVVGTFNYHGVPVPLIDLAELTLGKSSRHWMSTRIVLINYVERSGIAHLLGLLAERATETLHLQEEDFVTASVAAETPFLGPVVTNGTGFIQRLGIQNLISESVSNQLFPRQLEPV